jgi:hypothetical protein
MRSKRKFSRDNARGLFAPPKMLHDAEREEMPMAADKPDKNALIAMLPTPGWRLTGKDAPTKGRTLEELVRQAHQRHAAGESPGLVSKIETELELDMLQLQELWMYLGLPM